MNNRYKMTLEYDGTNFSGWQKQKDARTIQGDLFKGAERVFEKVVDVQGCGRTDAGVHALEYVAHLEVSDQMEPVPQDLMEKFNETLPKDIAVLAIEPVHPRFHARHNCEARSYIYQLRRKKSAFGKRYSWWVGSPLDISLMRQVALGMTGMLDYAAFAERRELKKSTKVLVHKVAVEEDNSIITVRVIGSHFLWRMVRRMVGILVEVGRGTVTEQQVLQLFEQISTLPQNHTAPAAGLFFEKAYYDKAELRKDLGREV